MFKGIDVSHNNGVIDWKKVKAAGIQFAMIRATHGMQLDRQFLYNIKNAIANGIDCGAYMFSYAVNRAEAIAEAKYFLNAIKPFKFTYPCAFDYEYYSVDCATKRGIKIDNIAACAIADGFMSEIAKAGYYIINYTNIDFITRYFNLPAMRQYENWVARWSRYRPTNITGLWQNEVRGSAADVKANPPRASVVGSLPGIRGAIDMDISYKDYPVIIRKAGLNHLNAPVPKPDPRPEPIKLLFKHGDIVKVTAVTKNGAALYGRTYTGVFFRLWQNSYNVIGSPKGDRVVIGIGNLITAAVKACDLEKLIK